MRYSSRALSWLCPLPSHKILVPEEVNHALNYLEQSGSQAWGCPKLLSKIAAT